MKRINIAAAIVVIVTGAIVGTAAATQLQDKINICHNTGSESHPWEAIRVDNNGYLNGHPDDFLYQGPTKQNGHPNDAQHQDDTWCNEHAPKDEPTPNPTPSPTPPSVDEPKGEQGTVVTQSWGK